MPHHILIMLAAGIAVPILAALNAALGRTIGSPAVAATVLFAVAFFVALTVALMTQPGAFSRLSLAPRHLFLGGVFIAFYLLSITWIAPIIGLGNAVFLVLLGQLCAAAAIDHFGLFNATISPLTLKRAGGLALMASGVFLVQKA